MILLYLLHLIFSLFFCVFVVIIFLFTFGFIALPTSVPFIMSTPSSYHIEFQSLFFLSEKEFMCLESEFPFSDVDPGLSAYLFTRNVIFKAAFASIPQEQVHRFWMSFDDVFLKDSAFFDSLIKKDSPDVLYVQSKRELIRFHSLVDSFFEFLYSFLGEYHPLFRRFLANVVFYDHDEMYWSPYFQRIASFIHDALTFFSNHCEQQSTYLLSLIKQSIVWKREVLELEFLAKRDDILTDCEDYSSFKSSISSFHDKEDGFSAFSTESIFSRFVKRFGMNPSSLSLLDKPALSVLGSSLRNTGENNDWDTVLKKSYSFGSFDDLGVFTYSGKLNVLAFIIHELHIKGWSSSGDKVHRFLEYIRIEGRVTTLIKYLEMVRAGKAEFAKSSFHDEAVVLFDAIIKNSE